MFLTDSSDLSEPPMDLDDDSADVGGGASARGASSLGVAPQQSHAPPPDPMAMRRDHARGGVRVRGLRHSARAGRGGVTSRGVSECGARWRWVLRDAFGVGAVGRVRRRALDGECVAIGGQSTRVALFGVKCNTRVGYVATSYGSSVRSSRRRRINLRARG